MPSRRHHGDGSIFERAGSWYYAISLGRHPETGKRRRRQVGGFESADDARRGMREALSAADRGELVDRNKTTLGGYLREWLDVQEYSLPKRSTYANYCMQLERYVTPHIGATRLQAVTPMQLDRLYRDLLANGRCNGTGGLAPRSVRSVHVVLRKALADAVRKGHLATNPADRADPPKFRKSHRGTAWSVEELQRFLDYTRERSQFHTLYLVALATGMRRGEILGLRWSDVDYLPSGEAVLNVRETIMEINGKMSIDTPKSHSSRRVPIDAATTAALQAYHHARRPGYFAAGARPARIFCHSDGRMISPSHVSKTFREDRSLAGVPPIRFHDLRHTHATLGLRAGVALKVMSERLGHADIAITADIYSHVDDQLQHAAAASVGALVHGVAR